MRRPTLVALVAVGAALLAAPRAGAAVDVAATPPLRPAFDLKVSDYVARCPSGKPLRVFVHASDGDRVSVGGGDRRGGTFEAPVSRAPPHAFTIRVRSGGGSTTHHVRCLPADFPDWTFDADGDAEAQWYLLAPTGTHAYGYMAFFDTDGVPVWWWYHDSGWGPWDANLMRDGTVSYARFFNDHFGIRGHQDAYEIRRLDGSLVRRVRTPGSSTDTHDMQQLPNGDYVLITYVRREGANLSPRGAPNRAVVYDCDIEELTPGGRLVWRWRSKDHIPISWTTGDNRSGWWAENGGRDANGVRTSFDLVHVNSVEPDGGDGLIVSARHLDAVLRISRKTGRIDWKLGGTHVRGKSLRVLGAPKGFRGERLFHGQHDARLWKDGSLTVYDNGTDRRPPVADRFVIDAKARTATLVEQVADPEITESSAIGSARKLAGGDWVVNWGDSPIVTEQTPAGSIVRRFSFAGDRWSYRTVPVEPGRLGARTLRRAMSSMVAAGRAAARR
jgi:Arylsulfotransferase (ASST)